MIGIIFRNLIITDFIFTVLTTDAEVSSVNVGLVKIIRADKVRR